MVRSRISRLPALYSVPLSQLSQCIHTRQVQKTSSGQLVFLHLLLSRCLQSIVRSSTNNGKGDRLFNLSWIILERCLFLTTIFSIIVTQRILLNIASWFDALAPYQRLSDLHEMQTLIVLIRD